MANRLLASHHLVNSSTRGPCECCASVRSFVTGRDTIFSFSSSSPRVLLATACLRPFFHLAFLPPPPRDERQARREKDSILDRNNFLPALSLAFFRSFVREVWRGRYLTRISKILFEKNVFLGGEERKVESTDGAREAKFYTYEKLYRNIAIPRCSKI